MISAESTRSQQMLRLTTVNSSSFNNDNANLILRFMNQHRLDVVCIQETHWDDSILQKYSQLFKDDLTFIANNTNTRERGTLTILRKRSIKEVVVSNVEISTEDLIEFPLLQNGRIVIISFSLNDTEFDVVNLYCPNNAEARSQFFRWTSLQINNLKGLTIIAGDWNCVARPEDRCTNQFSQHDDPETLKAFLNNSNIVDSFLYMHADAVETFTFFRKGLQLHQSRLDRIYISQQACNLIFSVDHIPNFASDHILSPLLVLKLEKSIDKGSGYWRMNSSLLDDSETVETLEALISATARNISQCQNPYKVWLKLKDSAKETLQRSANLKAAKNNRIRKRLEETMQFTKRVMIRNPGDEEARSSYSKAVYDLKEYSHNQLTLGARFSRSTHLLYGDKPSKYQMKKINTKSTTVIPTLKNKDGYIVSDCNRMKEIIVDFYTELFSPDPCNEDTQRSFLDSIQKRLSVDEQASLDAEATVDEILNVIKSSGGGTCPGIDGLSSEFYKKFSKNLAIILKSVFRFLFSQENIPKDFSKGIVTLIYKKGDTSELKNYRPITLLNADYKILTKLIALRLKETSEKLVGPAQFAFLAKRQVSDSVMTTQLAIASQIKKEKPGFILSLDNEKAYDRVVHTWIWKTLERFNFSNTFISNIKKLYLNATSCFLINGHLTVEVQQKRGVRQGDALSCYLFILAIAPLMSKINSSAEIKGFKCLKNKRELKVIAYADDLLFFVKDNTSFRNLRRILHSFQLASNAKANIQKSVICCLPGSSLSDADDFSRLENGEYIRQLGYQINGEGLAPESLCWNLILAKISTKIERLIRCNLTLQGRVALFNAVILPQISFTAQLIPPSKNTLRKLQSLTKSLIDNGKTNNFISIKLCELPIEEGGTGIHNLELYLNAYKINWIKRYYSNRDGIWQQILSELMLSCAIQGGELPDVPGDPITQKNLKLFDLPAPWPEIIKSWRELGGCLMDPKYSDEVLLHPIWLNEFIDSYRNKRAVDSLRECENIKTFNDIWDGRATWSSPPCNCTVEKRRMHQQAIISIRNTMEGWLEFPLNPGDNSPPHLRFIGLIFQDDQKQYPLDSLHPRQIYKKLVHYNCPLTKTADEVRDWLLARDRNPASFWRNIRNKWMDRRASELHWKISVKGLKIGRRLLHILPGATEEHLCRSCQAEETHEHVFFGCQKVMAAWRKFGNLYNRIWDKPIFQPGDPLWSSIRLGFRDKCSNKKMFNVTAGLFGEMIRAIWHSRNDEVFNNNSHSTSSILRKFCWLYRRLLDSILIAHIQERKLETFTDIWGPNGILVKRREGAQVRIIEEDELMATLM